jgi:diadenosine tetraphosphatase ApaH/serine/threonine PP2A family protein phosphatase
LETVFYLCSLKPRHPDRFFLLRGNHESRAVNFLCGFYAECQQRFGPGGIWMAVSQLFDLMPVAALIDERVFCVHGSLSPDVPVPEKLSLLNRNGELPSSGPLCDICWSDPEPGANEWRMNARGAGYIFGGGQAKAFCPLNGDLDFVARSHQLAMGGFQWFFDRKVVTVWSAPNYMYRSGNMGSVMKYTRESGSDSRIVIFGPMDEDKKRRPDELPAEPHFA